MSPDVCQIYIVCVMHARAHVCVCESVCVCVCVCACVCGFQCRGSAVAVWSVIERLYNIHLVACAGSLAVEPLSGSAWCFLGFLLHLACRIRFSLFSIIVPL